MAIRLARLNRRLAPIAGSAPIAVGGTVAASCLAASAVFAALGPIVAFIVVAAIAPVTASADILHLKNGGAVEGQVLEADDQAYRVRTAIGIVSVPAESVERVEKTDTPLGEYDRRLADTPDTADGWFALAQWCEQHGLTAARTRHLKRVLELDADHAGARAALGYVRVGDVWVDGSRTTSQPAAGSATSAPARGPDESPERLIRSIQGRWAQRIRAIQQHQLEASFDRMVAAGRKQILEIRDPLAILPMARILSAGGYESRRVLAEALSQFTEDEATLNLTVLALTDEDAGIRRLCAVELAKRGDPRVGQQLREALRSDSDALIRNAARALEILRDPAAVPNLIDVLTVQRRKWVEVPVRRYFGQYTRVFNTHTQVSFGGQSFTHEPTLGIDRGMTPGGVLLTPQWQERDVTVYRTAVLEALKAITGQNFGFEAAAWRRWYEEQSP